MELKKEPLDYEGFVARFGAQPEPSADLRAYLTWHQRLIMLLQMRNGIAPGGVERSLEQIEEYEFPDGTFLMRVGAGESRRWIDRPVGRPLPRLV
jgi:hypothetical protein